ncbi:MAG: cytochrome c3 family protein [Bacteroidota bacterium]
MLRTFYLISIIILFFTNLYSQDFECTDCHDDIHVKGEHQDILGCNDCHSDVIDESHSESGAQKVQCTSCHDDKYLSTVNSDIHHRLKNVVKNPPSCNSCHGNHHIYSPSRFKDPTKQLCSTCHDDEKVVFPSQYHVKQKEGTACYECHEEEEHKPVLAQSVHSNLTCVDCHSYISKNIEAHEDGGLTANQTANCYTCHNDVAKIHEESIHGISLAEGIDDAAMCWDCHGSHDIVNTDSTNSKVNIHNIGSTCGSCHDDPKFEEKHHMSIVLPGQMYSNSVHGKLINTGEENAASCVSCHGDHDIKNRVQDGSKISPINIPNTCDECHSEIVAEYKNSIHWLRVKKGIKEAPVCNDCHSEHSIDQIDDKDKNGDLLEMQENTCIRCHQDKTLNKKFGNKGTEVAQYLNSYHGLASLRGGNNAALCIDCHGVHSIWSKSNPASTVNESNVTETCRKCHKDASETFAKSYSHETESQEAKNVEDLVTTIYFWLIIAVIGGMIGHNLIIFAYELRRRRRKEKNVIRLPRFTKNEVIQHFFLLSSFIILAITGFALKYPNSFWSEGLLELGMTEPIRANIHRVSAVIMGALSIYHVVYLLLTPRGRDVLFEMLPKFEDLTGIVDNLMFYLRLSKKHPHFNQYDYAEKAEYWALIWGTFVMGATGFFLWFPTIIGDWAPIWLIKVSEIIHFYEAILASLAILVWHWFFVIFHPSEYPMSFTWIDGQMSLANYRHHHEKSFRRLLLEWHEYQLNNNDTSKLGNYTKLFISTLEKNDFDPGEVLQNELNNDPELRVWYENEISITKD